MRSDRLASELTEAFESKVLLNQCAESLAEELFHVIGSAPADLKPVLVGLRRKVRRRARPEGRERSGEVADLLAAAGLSLADYLAARERLAGCRDRIQSAAEAATEDCLAGLTAAWQQDTFRRALAQAAPELCRELARWQRGGPRPQKQKLVRTAKYVARAAAKISPNSTFTVSSCAGWLFHGSGEEALPDFADCTIQIVATLDGDVVSGLSDSLAGAALTDATVLTPNPSLVRSGEDLIFIVPGRSEEIRRLRAAPAVLAPLALAHPSITAGRLAQRLVHQSGATTEQAMRFLQAAVTSGVLEVVRPVPDLEPHPWEGLADWVSRSAPAAENSVAGLHAIGSALATSTATLDEDEIAVRNLRVKRSVAEIGRTHGLQLTDTIHEFGQLGGQPLDCSAGFDRLTWQRMLGDLDVVRRLTAVFDPATASRALIGPWLRVRFGVGAEVPLTLVYQDLCRALSQPEDGDLWADARAVMGVANLAWNQDLSGCSDPRLRWLAAERDAIRAWVGPAEQAEHRIPIERAAERVAGWPDWLVAPGSTGCYVQPLHIDGEPVLALNVLHGGYGRGHGFHSDDRPAARSHTHATLEVGGLFGSSLNARLPRAEYEVVMPGCTPSGKTRSVGFGALTVRHDASRDTASLRVPGEGRDVLPLHLGMSSEFSLPGSVGLLFRAFGDATLLHPSSPALMPRIGGPLAAGEQGRPRVFGRVRIGSIVLQRHRVVMRPGDFPRQEDFPSNADRLLALDELLRSLGLGRRFFARGWSRGTGDNQVKTRKPMFIDVCSPWLSDVLQQILHGAEVLVLEEALPDPVETDRISELFVTLTETASIGQPR